MDIGRRIIFEKSTGKIILDMGEMSGDILPREDLGELDHIDLPFGQDADKFKQGIKAYHIDPETKTLIIDEVMERVLTPEQQQIEDLQNKLLVAEGVI